MCFDDKKPEKRPLYIFVLIAVVVILLLNMFAIPAMQERSIEKTDYSTFLTTLSLHPNQLLSPAYLFLALPFSVLLPFFQLFLHP